MRALGLTLLAAAICLVLATVATAKVPVPSEATISGPGLSHPLELRGGKTGRWAVDTLTVEGGFFQAVMPGDIRPMLPGRPQGKLGPKYTVRYVIPRWRWHRGSGLVFRVKQELYPYADGGVVTYLKPGQRVFNFKTPGGWFRGGARLKETLARIGLPATAPSALSSKKILVLLVAGSTLLLLAGVVLLASRRRNTSRRRSRHARL
ncbi:MAG: hypothetical protein WBB76_11045, partial [Gaiellaceae bacterium]